MRGWALILALSLLIGSMAIAILPLTTTLGLALIAAVAIPTSIISTFALMQAMGLSDTVLTVRLRSVMSE